MNTNEIMTIVNAFNHYYKYNRKPSTSKLEQFSQYLTNKALIFGAVAQLANKYYGGHVAQYAFNSIDEGTLERMEKSIKYYAKQWKHPNDSH